MEFVPDAQPQRIANEISRLFTDESYVAHMHQDLLKVRKKFGEGGATHNGRPNWRWR
jgi:hypothetical protein